jgi:hypothetical protein
MVNSFKRFEMSSSFRLHSRTLLPVFISIWRLHFIPKVFSCFSEPFKLFDRIEQRREFELFNVCSDINSIIYNIVPLCFACFRWYRRRLAEFIWTRKSGCDTSNLYSFRCATSSHSRNGLLLPGEFSFGLDFLVNESCVTLGNAISCWKFDGAFESSEWKPLDVLCRLDLLSASRMLKNIGLICSLFILD